MKLYELLENVTVQGPVSVVTFDDEAEIDLFSTDDFEAHRHEIHEEVREMEIAYIFPCASYTDGAPVLKIELKPREED